MVLRQDFGEKRGGTAVLCKRCHYLPCDQWEQNVYSIATMCILATFNMACTQDRCFSHLSYNRIKLQKKTQRWTVQSKCSFLNTKLTPNHITVGKKCKCVFSRVRQFSATLGIKSLNIRFCHHFSSWYDTSFLLQTLLRANSDRKSDTAPTRCSLPGSQTANVTHNYWPTQKSSSTNILCGRATVSETTCNLLSFPVAMTLLFSCCGRLEGQLRSRRRHSLEIKTIKSAIDWLLI